MYIEFVALNSKTETNIVQEKYCFVLACLGRTEKKNTQHFENYFDHKMSSTHSLIQGTMKRSVDFFFIFFPKKSSWFHLKSFSISPIKFCLGAGHSKIMLIWKKKLLTIKDNQKLLNCKT